MGANSNIGIVDARLVAELTVHALETYLKLARTLYLLGTYRRIMNWIHRT